MMIDSLVGHQCCGDWQWLRLARCGLRLRAHEAQTNVWLLKHLSKSYPNSLFCWNRHFTIQRCLRVLATTLKHNSHFDWLLCVYGSNWSKLLLISIAGFQGFLNQVCRWSTSTWAKNRYFYEVGRQFELRVLLASDLLYLAPFWSY